MSDAPRSLPHLEDPLRVLALTCLVRGIGLAPRALLQRSMAFRALALIGFAGIFVYGAVAVGLAARGIGVWSLDATDVLRADANAVFLSDDYHLGAVGHRRVAVALAPLVASLCPTGGVSRGAPAGAATRRMPMAAPASRDRPRSGQEQGRWIANL